MSPYATLKPAIASLLWSPLPCVSSLGGSSQRNRPERSMPSSKEVPSQSLASSFPFEGIFLIGVVA